MNVLLHGGDGVSEDLDDLVIGLNSEQMLQLRNNGRVEVDHSSDEAEFSVVIGHEDDFGVLTEEVNGGE